MKTRICAICQTSFVLEQHRGMALVCNPCSQRCALCDQPHRAGGLCSAHRMQWQRAGKPDVSEFIRAVNAGEMPGKAVWNCVECGKPYNAIRGIKTCSAECTRARKQRRWREGYHRLPPEKKESNSRRQKERLQEKPELAAAQYKRQWEKRKQDPEYIAKSRIRAKEFYQQRAAEIQARRKDRFEGLPEAEKEELKTRMREYTRNWRRQTRNDPERSESYKAYEIRYRAQKRMERVELEMLAIMSATAQPSRKCAQCHTAIVRGKTIYCPDCKKARARVVQAQARATPQTRECVICGDEFPTLTNVITCSEECRLERRRRQTYEYRHRETANQPGNN